MMMTDEEQLKAALRRPPLGGPLNVGALLDHAHARLLRRRRGRRALLATATVATLTVALVAAPYLRGGQTRLEPATPNPPGQLLLTVTSATITPAVPGLSVQPAAYPVRLSDRVAYLTLIWAIEPQGPERTIIGSTDQQVTAESGGGLLELRAGRDNCPAMVACAASLPGAQMRTLAPGTTGLTTIVVAPSVRTATAGTYRLTLPIPGTDAHLDTVFEAKPAPPASYPPAPTVTVYGDISGIRPSQPLTITRGAPAGVDLIDARTGLVASTASTDGTFALTIDSGTYYVIVGAYNAECLPTRVTVGPASPRLNIGCDAAFPR